MEGLILEQLLKIADTELPSHLSPLSTVNPFTKDFLESEDKVRTFCFEYKVLQIIKDLKEKTF